MGYKYHCIIFLVLITLSTSCSKDNRPFRIIKLNLFENEKLNENYSTEKVDVYYIIGFQSLERDSIRIIDYIKAQNEADKYNYYGMLFFKKNHVFEKRMESQDSIIYDNDFSENDYVFSVSFQNKLISLATYYNGEKRSSKLLKSL